MKDQLSESGWQTLQGFLAAESTKSSGTADTSSVYEKVRGRLLLFFRWRGCISPEEYTDATFDRVARTLSEGKVVREKDPTKFVLGVARLIFFERSKSEIRQKVAEKHRATMYESSTVEEERRLQALEDCMKSLPKAERHLLLRYHRSAGGTRIVERKALAEKHGISLNTLRIRMHRERQSLSNCIDGKLI